MLLSVAVLISCCFYVLAAGESEQIVWQRDEKKVAITFDDGPDAKTTELLLDGLKARKVRATFFVIGEKAEQNPELICRMSDEGHLIGNHTYSHVQLNMLSSSQACSQVKAANDVIKEITGQEVIYLRPPYGEWDHKKDCPQNMMQFTGMLIRLTGSAQIRNRSQQIFCVRLSRGILFYCMIFIRQVCRLPLL